MARGWRNTNLSLLSALLLSFSGMSFCRFCFCFLFYALVGVPVVFSCSVDHISGWQPRILPGKVEAQSVKVKNTRTPTHIQRIGNRHCCHM